MKLTRFALAILALASATLFAVMPAMALQAKPAPKAAATSPGAPKPTPPNSADIASAKTKGLVWVNLNTKVYHGSADKEYGTTKNGKFMTKADAQAAGARAAKH
jgi:hypothetical protein